MQFNQDERFLLTSRVDAANSNGLLDGTSAPVPEYFAQKARLTRVFGAVLLLIASPIILFLALLVYCTSRGPAIIRQRRVGKNGEEFTMYKIRTMCNHAEEETGPVWSQPDDSRLCRVGKMLRFLHLDELPQLLNVVRGEMDLVGPRPERPELIDDLLNIPGYLERYRVLPGVTGLAQINLPPDVNIDSVCNKLVLDEEYIQTASLGLDTRIVLCSALRMLGIHGGYAVNWFGLSRCVPGSVACQADPDRVKVDIGETVETATGSGFVDSARANNNVRVLPDFGDQEIVVARGSITGASADSPTGVGHGKGDGDGEGPLTEETRTEAMEDKTNTDVSETDDLPGLLRHPK